MWCFGRREAFPAGHVAAVLPQKDFFFFRDNGLNSHLKFWRACLYQPRNSARTRESFLRQMACPPYPWNKLTFQDSKKEVYSIIVLQTHESKTINETPAKLQITRFRCRQIEVNLSPNGVTGQHPLVLLGKLYRVRLSIWHRHDGRSLPGQRAIPRVNRLDKN